MSQPIHDPHAEQATLGGCMLKTAVAQDIVEILRADDFYVPRHEIIYSAIVDLVNGGNPTDPVAVVDTLLRAGTLTQAGGADYVHSLTSAVSVAQQAVYHANTVHDRAVRRRVVEGALIAVQEAPTADLGTLIEGARKRIDDAAGLQRQEIVYVGDLIEQIVADAEKPRRVYRTPWASLDDVLTGFRPGGLYVVAARPGIGKTAIALQMASALAIRGPVAFSSLEMPKEELVRRIIAQGVRMPHHLLEAGRPLPEVWKWKIEEWIRNGAPHGIAIDDRSTVTPTDVRAFARAVQRPSGQIGGIVCDYLQLMGGPSGMKRYEVVSENARQFKLMARDLDCPVILLSQLNRDPEKRIDKRPALSDLRDSGAIEQDADVVALLYRDPEFEQAPMGAPPLPVPLEFDVAKNRHGPTHRLTLTWEGSQMRAYDGREDR